MSDAERDGDLGNGAVRLARSSETEKKLHISFKMRINHNHQDFILLRDFMFYQLTTLMRLISVESGAVIQK